MADSGLLSKHTLDILRKNKPRLCEDMKPRIEFITELESKKVLTKQQCDRVKAETTDYDKNSLILDFLAKGSQLGYTCFSAALVNTGQMHLASHLFKERG